MARFEELLVDRSEPEMVGIGIGLKGSQKPETLYLSEFDQCYRFHLPWLSFYNREDENAESPDPAEVLREALKRALVYYYPLAGRLREVPEGQGRLQVVCNGEGVVFAEAQASCSLQDTISINDNEFVVHSPSLLVLDVDQALPLHETPLLTFQVTWFTCGGFAVGIQVSHVLMDGEGYSQFMKALGEIARQINGGGNQDIVLSLSPIWERDLLDPACFSNNINESRDIEKPLRIVSGVDEDQASTICKWSFFVGRGALDGIKQDFRCSTFQALTALVWTTYSKCLDFTLMGLSFTMNVRHLLFDSDLASRYYGNCVVQVQVTQEDLLHDIDESNTENPKGIKDVKMRDVIRAIKRAKERIDMTYLRSHILSLSSHVYGDKEEEVNMSMIHFIDHTKVCYTPDFGMGKGAHGVMPYLFPSILFLPTLTGAIRVDATMDTNTLPIFKSLISESLKALREEEQT